MKISLLSLCKSILIGLVIVLLSVIALFFLKPDGVKINTEAWPPSAKSILLEQPGVPITDEQYKRISKALKSSENESLPSHTFAAEIRAAWILYIPLPLIALIVVFYLRPSHPFFTGIFIATPSLLLLIWAFLHTHSYFS